MVMLNFYLNAPEDSPFNSENPEEDMRVGFEDGHFTFASEMNRDEINFYISQGIPNLEHLPQFLLPCGIQDGNRDGVVDFQDFMDSLILASMLWELKPTDVGQNDGPTQQELCDNLLLFVHRADPQASADHVDAAALSRLLPYLADYKLLPETRDWDAAANKLVSKFGDGLVLDQPAFSSFVRSLDYTWYLMWKVEMGGPLQATLLGEYVEQNEE